VVFLYKHTHLLKVSPYFHPTQSSEVALLGEQSIDTSIIM